MTMDILDFMFDDDEDTLLQMFMTSMGVFHQLPEPRNSSHFEQRLAWEEYSLVHVARGTFDIRLRMSLDSFNKLLGFIRDDLLVVETKAKLRGGSIVPELCLYCTIRWLAGGSYLDITDVSGISKSSFYRVVWKTITAICKCQPLRPKFPKTNDEIGEAVRGFASLSTDGVIDNCVGVIDGYLLRIKVPCTREAKNVKSFFSGHYQCYGVNVQAVADHHCRFTFIAFAGPGVMGDKDAFGETSLKELTDNLPFGICIIGDAAYCPSEHVIPVYQGLCKMQSKYDNFNYFASQLRIRIEMAFGMMSMKWGILNHPVGCSLSNLKWLIQAIGSLHNFCINERLAREGGDMEIARDPPDAINIPRYIPTVPHDINGDPIDLGELFKGTVEGHSILREHMADKVAARHLVRQGNNGLRRRADDE
jgi:DDE superfamily endonuclease